MIFPVISEILWKSRFGQCWRRCRDGARPVSTCPIAPPLALDCFGLRPRNDGMGSHIAHRTPRIHPLTPSERM